MKADIQVHAINTMCVEEAMVETETLQEIQRIKVGISISQNHLHMIREFAKHTECSVDQTFEYAIEDLCGLGAENLGWL